MPTITEAMHVLSISHRHGTDGPFLFTDRVALIAYLAAFARNWWVRENVPGEIPADDAAAIAQYFAFVQDAGDGETFSIDEIQPNSINPSYA